MKNNLNNHIQNIHHFGNQLADIFKYLALFGIGSTIVWSAIHDYLFMVKQGYASLEDILLLFIYLELGAMVGTYFKTSRLPVQFLIYIAITAISRHLVIDMQKLSDTFHLQLLLAGTLAIAILSSSVWILSNSAKKYGCPEDKQSTSQQGDIPDEEPDSQN